MKNYLSRGFVSLFSLLGLFDYTAEAQSKVTSGGWFMRGTGTNFGYYSFVVPLDSQQGASNAPSLGTSLAHFGHPILYHYDATNTLSQNTPANRIAFSNAVVAFGSKYGGSPLYFNQAYHFGAYSGDITTQPQVLVTLVNRATGAYTNSYGLPLPVPSNASTWATYVANGGSMTWSNFIPGLTATFSQSPYGPWGVTNYGGMVMTFTADTNAGNYEYTFWIAGTVHTGASAYFMVVDSTDAGAFSPMATMTFDAKPPLLPPFVNDPQFQGKPLPPAYEGKSLTELLAVHATVANAVSSTATNWLDLDNSPELRDSPVLDQFVADMGSNALALTSYVFNRIQLCDAIAYTTNTGYLLDPAIYSGGVNRGALGVYLEGEGSPFEQCALLVYLLRRAGVPACYIYGPADGIQMLDARLSMLLRMQIKGAVNQSNGQLYTTNSLISVNYPWVAAYIGGSWVHLFPWLKDTQVTEGLNLYDYMPAGYGNGAQWVKQYLHGDTNIFSLNPESDAASVLFPLFVQKALLTTAPGVSFGDIGVSASDREVQFTTWTDFPTPFAVTNGTVNTVHDLTTITNILPTWTNIFDTISVRVYSSLHTNLSLYTGDLRMADLQDRKFIIRHQPTNSGNYSMVLSLAPFRPALSNAMAFTNDADLLHQETIQVTVATNDDPNVTFIVKRHRTGPSSGPITNAWTSYLNVSEVLNITNTLSIKVGDLAAICLHSGRVSEQMLTPWAQEYWTMQQEVAANPAITNTLSPDITQGTLPYLMGMSYYERIHRFRDQAAQWHKVTAANDIGEGLSVISAQRNTNGVLVLTNGALILRHPHVDMYESIVTTFGNRAARPDESGDPTLSKDSFLRLYTTEASAQEHKVIEDFYGAAGGISSVRLLLQAQQTNQPGIYEMDINNFTSHPGLSTADPAMWSRVTAAFQSPSNTFTDVYITQKAVTNTTVGYSGMGCLIYGWSVYGALISGNGIPANGGWGIPLSFPYYNPPNFNNVSLSFNTSQNNNWSVSYSAPTIASPSFLSENIAPWDAPTTYNNLVSTALSFGGANSVQQQQFDVAAYNLGFTGAAAYQDTVNNGGDYVAQVGPELAQLSGTVADPVNVVTGEFYIEANDLSLPGSMPLLIRRNYSSQNVDLGNSQFGYGWRPAYQPYLRLNTNNVILACEMDGTVVAYRQPIPGTKYWKPFPADNPQLNNRSTAGIGSTASLFNNFITNVVVAGVTNFYLNGSDGSVRFFQYANYPVAGSVGNLDRNRPYLKTWTDANGNSFSFAYQTDSTQPDYGQVRRIQSSNGNFVVFSFDVFGHITDADTGDERHMHYDYDDHGDLTTVTLPDESQINYTYQHSTVLTNSTTNIVSTHLIVQEQKPDGRVLANTYDSLRRVTIQAATVGNDLNLVTNATFYYINNCTNLTNTILSGTNYVVDVFGRTNTYLYTSNWITRIQDALGQTISQVWFSNTNDPGYFPNSLKSLTDKRQLKTDYQYDSFGNLSQVIQTGNLTGGSVTNETATNTFTYTARNLVSTATDPYGNQIVYAYTNTAYPFLPTSTIKYAAATPVATNQYFYTNVVQTVTNGAVVAVNSSYGLLQRSVEGGFCTNDFTYDGRGFKTQQTAYTRTADPAVVTSFSYSDRGDLVSTTDSAGRSHAYAYDGMGRQTQVEVYELGATTPLGFNYTYYNENGEVVWTDGSRYNPEDYVWRDYDGAGRKITEMRWRSEAKPDGSGVQAASDLYATTFYQYDAFNNLTQVTDPLGNYIVQSFDAIGQLTKQVFYGSNGLALATNTFGYEPGGLLAFSTNALCGVTAKTYTSTGKLKFQSNPNGSTNSWRYDLSGRPITEFLANGNYWQTSFDDANLSITKIFYHTNTPLATNTAQFDARGNVTQTTDFQGAASTNFYDGLNRLKVAAGPPTITVTTSGLDPNSTNYVTNVVQEITTYIYDASGQTLTVSNAVGERTVFTNDALARVTGVGIYPSNSAVPVRVVKAFYSADGQSVTITNGTGSTAIVTTAYSDNDGHTVLNIGYPNAGTNEYVLQQYDRAGNRIAQQQCSLTGSSITVWATNGWTYDGLNRIRANTIKDGATTIFSYDALGNVTNRAMPGSLTWSATYQNDGRIATEQTTGGALTERSMAYSYFSSGPNIGMLQTITDGRSTTFSSTYDDFLRLSAVNTGGTADEQKTATTYEYDPLGELKTVSQSFSNSVTGPSTTLTRTYDVSHRVTSDSVSIGGGSPLNASQGWDAAGRRVSVSAGVMGIGFGYQADGLMTAAGAATFAYANNGLITGRANPTRTYAVNQRDGRGRLLQSTTTVLTSTILGENLTWRNDGRLASYVASRSDATLTNDIRNYSYSTLAQRLTQESFNTSTGSRLTNTYTIDRGTNGGLGILTATAQSGAGSATWTVPASGGLDTLDRVIAGQNTTINRSATGKALGAANVTATLDNNPVAVQFDGTDADGRWRANLDLTPGSHTLKVAAAHPSGQYTALATNTFTANGGAIDTVTNLYDGSGNITKRIWLTGSTTNRTQTLTWDAFDRLIKVSDRDSVGSGFDHASVYDGLGRRVRTVYTMVVSNSAITSPAGAISTVDSYYDPQVEFLEIATSVNGQFTFKTYGPDANGAYGGLNGVGGLEVLTAFGSSSPTGLIQDCFGNVVASVKSLSVTWNSNRVSSYGPVPGYQAPALSINVPLVQSLGWRGKRVDETGLINLGARVYDPQAGRFLSADPMGHSGSADLYSFADGDPVNNFDADGRFGREAFTDGPSSIQEWFNSTVLAPVREVREQVAFENQYVDSQRPDGAVASMFFDAIPLLGQAKMFLETLTGKDSVTGEPVNEYVHAALTVLGVLSLGEGWAGTETTFAGAGERGLVNAGEKVLPQTEEQLEFQFVNDNLSGNLSTLETGAVGTAPLRSNSDLVQEAATRAEAWGTRQGLPAAGGGPVQGTLKHDYAARLLDRYQSRYGNRGLVTEGSWRAGKPENYGAHGSVRLDVFDTTSSMVYDYKFTLNPSLSSARVGQIIKNGPAGITGVVPVGP